MTPDKSDVLYGILGTELHNEEAQWQRAASIVERFLNISEDVP